MWRVLWASIILVVHDARNCCSPIQFWFLSGKTFDGRVILCTPSVFKALGRPDSPSVLRNATVVNAMDGDGVLYQDDLDAMGVRILPGYNSGFSNHNMPYTTGEARVDKHVGACHGGMSTWTIESIGIGIKKNKKSIKK